MNPFKVLEQNSDVMKRYEKSKSSVIIRAPLVLKFYYQKELKSN